MYRRDLGSLERDPTFSFSKKVAPFFSQAEIRVRCRVLPPNELTISPERMADLALLENCSVLTLHAFYVFFLPIDLKKLGSPPSFPEAIKLSPVLGGAR